MASPPESAPKRPFNPGTFEDLHKPTKDVFPTNFEGARLMVQRALSNHFQVSHILNMSSSDPSGYRFGATFVGTKLLGPGEAFPILLGDVDPSGNVSANIIHQFGERLRTKAFAQIQKSKYQSTKLSADYMGDNYTASLMLGNIDLLKNSGVVVGHYLQVNICGSSHVIFS
jgi:mitochondrial import receptor subunit TOM40